jgi:uncharacterized protein YndB with AHSA1/START domain
MTESLRTVDGRTELRMERHLDHPQALVWRAVTEPEQMRHWFPAVVEFDAVVGGKVRYSFEGTDGADDGGDGGGDGDVSAYEPPRLFEYTWNGSVLRWELVPEPGGGTLTAVEAPRLLEYDGPDGHVRWELGEGTGHGARLVVTATGPADTSETWRDRVERLAADVAATP